LKIGDYVGLYASSPSSDTEDSPLGVVIGFNETGEGGRHFVHVLTDAGIEIFSAWNLYVITDHEED
jgi:hypothetical protein